MRFLPPSAQSSSSSASILNPGQYLSLWCCTFALVFLHHPQLFQLECSCLSFTRAFCPALLRHSLLISFTLSVAFVSFLCFHLTSQLASILLLQALHFHFLQISLRLSFPISPMHLFKVPISISCRLFSLAIVLLCLPILLYFSLFSRFLLCSSVRSDATRQESL